MRPMYWLHGDIRMEYIDGDWYALNGWNGEKYLHCWKCIDEWTAYPDKKEYEIVPVYDMRKWNPDTEEFYDDFVGVFNGIIGYEVL